MTQLIKAERHSRAAPCISAVSLASYTKEAKGFQKVKIRHVRSCRRHAMAGRWSDAITSADSMKRKSRLTIRLDRCTTGRVNGGEPYGCGLLGSLYCRGLGVSQRATSAISLIQKACESGSMYWCDDLGVIYYSGGCGVTEDNAQGVSYFEKACHSGDEGACSDACKAGDRSSCGSSK